MRYLLTCPVATVVFAEPGGVRLTGNSVVVIPLRSCYFYFNLSSLWIAAQQSFDCYFIFLMTIFCQPFWLVFTTNWPVMLYVFYFPHQPLAPLFPPYKKPLFWQSCQGWTPERRTTTKGVNWNPCATSFQIGFTSVCATNWQDLESIK